MGNVEQGFLLLADLTGYTAYLARGELAHAPVIAGDLLETIVGRLEPPFRLGGGTARRGTRVAQAEGRGRNICRRGPRMTRAGA